MVGERGVTFFVYLLVVVDEILGIVAVAGVSEYAKSGGRISVVVFTAACRRTANTFAIDMRTLGDILIDIFG